VLTRNADSIPANNVDRIWGIGILELPPPYAGATDHVASVNLALLTLFQYKSKGILKPTTSRLQMWMVGITSLLSDAVEYLRP